MFKKFMCKAGISMVMEEAGIDRDRSLFIIRGYSKVIKGLLEFTEDLTSEDRDLVLAHVLMVRFEKSLRTRNQSLDFADQLATGIERVEDQLSARKNLPQGRFIYQAQDIIETALPD